MRVYELMVIHDGDLDDVQVQDALKDVRAKIEEVATIANVDFWGRRRFAYEINHKTEGHYVVIELLSGGGINATVERQLRLADAVVRHKLLRLPDAEATRRGFFGEVEVAAAAPAAS